MRSLGMVADRGVLRARGVPPEPAVLRVTHHCKLPLAPDFCQVISISMNLPQMAADLPNEMGCLELEDVASFLGVSELTIHNYLNDNDLPCTGDGRGRRFVWSDVREWYVQYRIDLSGSRGSGRLGAETISTPETFGEAQLRKIKGEADLVELKLTAMHSHPEAEGRRTVPPVGCDLERDKPERSVEWGTRNFNDRAYRHQ